MYRPCKQGVDAIEANQKSWPVVAAHWLQGRFGKIIIIIANIDGHYGKLLNLFSLLHMNIFVYLYDSAQSVDARQYLFKTL